MALKDEDDSRIILLNEVDETPISTAVHMLFAMAQKDKKSPIHVLINTFGGMIYDMLALYDAIKYVQNLGVPVNTIGLGKIMSAGVILLSSGNTRRIGKNATIMWHWGSDSIEGDMFELRNELEEVERIEDLCNQILIEETKMTNEEIEKLLSPRTNIYITPEKAIDYGIVDSLLETATIKHTKPKKKTSKKRTTNKK